MSSLKDATERVDPGAPPGRVRLGTDFRVVAGLGAMLVLVALGIAIAVWLILDLRTATTDFAERDLEYAAAIGDIALVSKTLANDERGFLISGSDRVPPPVGWAHRAGHRSLQPGVRQRGRGSVARGGPREEKLRCMAPGDGTEHGVVRGRES